MKKHIYDESNGLSYTLHGDYYLPDLAVNEEELTYGKYGMLRKQFLKVHRPARYQYLLMTGELTAHLNRVDQETREQVETLKIIFAILIFSIIILFHELGHFLFAKRAGIRVNEFCIGLGPTLVGFTKGETKYSIKLLPFGGACMMEGEDGDSKAEDSFQSKSVGARISVVAAGPVFNFIMAFVCALILVACTGYDRPVISGVMDGYPAQEAGMKEGDVIKKLNSKKIHLYREVSIYTFFHGDQSIDVVYERDGKTHETTITPRYDKENDRYLFGFYGSGERTKGGLVKTLQYGVYEVKYWLSLIHISEPTRPY